MPKKQKLYKVDHSNMKLGKLVAKHDPRTLKLGKYLQLLTPKPAVDWTKAIADWGMMLNDNLGCCTIAAMGHAMQVWTANSWSSEFTVPDSAILQKYEMWAGYNPADPSTDQGAVELDVLNKWRQSPPGFWGQKLLAYAEPDPANINHVKLATELFGGVYIGLSLPISAQTQAVWDVADGPNGEPGSWGGHAVFVPAYDATGLTCITWGQLKKMTWAFWAKYCDESHALLGADWVNQKSPEGFDLATLQADLGQIKN